MGSVITHANVRAIAERLQITLTDDEINSFMEGMEMRNFTDSDYEETDRVSRQLQECVVILAACAIGVFLLAIYL
jgi:hypothetical protein